MLPLLISWHATLVLATQAIYISLLVFKASSALLSSGTHFVQVTLELQLMYGEWVGPANELQRTSILDSLDLRPFLTSKNWVFFTTLRGVVYTYKFIFKLTIFYWLDKMSRVYMVLFCKLIGSTRARGWKSTTFPADVTRLSPPPSFWGESLGTRAAGDTR